MTGMLKQVMHERADELGHSSVDLDAVLRDADRRIRRRRVVAVAAGAASVVAMAALAMQFVPSGGGTTQVTDGSDAVPYAISYASGETIHVGESELDVGHSIRAYVQTDAGYVFTSTDRTVYTFVDGTAERVGSIGRAVDMDQTELVADGPRVAWVDEQDGATVLDVGSGDVSHTAVEEIAEEHAAPLVTALDGTTAYFVDARGVVVWDSTTGAVTVRGSTARVVDAESGLLFTKEAGDDGDGAIVSPSGSVPVPLDDFGNLSPDGRYLTTEYHDEGFLRDAHTGAELPFDPAHDWALGYQWLDDDTFATMAFDENDSGSGYGRPSLLTCSAVTGGCRTTVAALPHDIGEFQLPIGIAIRD